MKAFLIALVRVDDPEAYKQYAARTPAIIATHGGRFVVRGGAVETIEGTPYEDRIVILEFPSKDAFRSFYASPEYQEVKKIRQAASEATFLLVDGVAEGVETPADQVTKPG